METHPWSHKWASLTNHLLATHLAPAWPTLCLGGTGSSRLHREQPDFQTEGSREVGILIPQPLTCFETKGKVQKPRISLASR